MKTASILFHQGWTDIINSLSLINIHHDKYDNINLIVREDAKPMIEYYISQFSNVVGCYYNIEKIDKELDDIIKIFQDTELLFFGFFDSYRSNKYTNSFNNNNGFFVEKFYTSYDIEYIERVNSFQIARNYEKENELFNQFISQHGTSYILYHGVPTIQNSNHGYNWVDLDKTTYTFFDYLKIIENAKEIHLLDSVWGALIYQIDAKYKLLNNIPIKVYCNRGYVQMFTEPVKLDNWEIL